MKILFRTDAGPKIGAGHAMRCLALAQSCRDARVDVLFAAVSSLPVLTARLAEERIAMRPIDSVPGSAEDAALTVALAREERCTWVVLDGYVFAADFQQAIKQAGLRLLVMDDYGHAESYHADVVLNQNIRASASLYPRRERSTRLLLGSRFVLLRREFARWREWRRTIAADAAKILVTFGGADPVNATATALEALRDVPGNLEIVAVTARDFQEPRLRVLHHAEEMDQHMAWADLAIAAAGTTSWELAFMQTPQIVLPIADNQRPVAAGLAAAGAAVDAGWHADVTPAGLRERIVSLLADAATRGRMAKAGRRVVDGCGAERVILHLRSKSLRLRPVESGDCQMLWEWANAPDVRAVSFSSEPIPWEDHCRWFAARLADVRCVFLLAMNDAGEPVAQVRFDLAEQDATISASVDQRFRGCGCGSAVILLAGQALFQKSAVQTIHAYIKPDNVASLRAFANAGYHRRADESAAAHLVCERDDFPDYEAA